jgi:hypothetical protein
MSCRLTSLVQSLLEASPGLLDTWFWFWFFFGGGGGSCIWALLLKDGFEGSGLGQAPRH